LRATRRRDITGAMFVVSKLLGPFTDPGNLTLLALVVGAVLLFTRARRFGRGLIVATAAILVLIAALPVGDFLLIPLENRFPAAPLPDKVGGIVVLGGQVRQLITAARGRPTLAGSAERMTAFVALARRYPDARLVFTGGSASLEHPELKEAPVARAFFVQQGIDVARIVFEDRSRNTWENALYTKQAMAPAPGETWLLVTSANHMPRAYGCFARVGWKVFPFPVDYLTTGRYEFTPGLSLAGGLARLELAVHEWLGLAVYYAAGFSDSPFPGPDTAVAGQPD
jgi:uncharacterized SAM-binding protein YcdF (DUF218 family)